MTTHNVPPGVGYAAREPVKAPPWHSLVVWDMLCNGLATGLFLVAALGELVMPHVFTPMAKFAYPAALVFLTIDLVLLVVDLGDPRRFHHMLRVFKPESPMSLGVWSLTMFSLPLSVAALLSLLPESPALEWARKIAVVLGIVPALGSVVYKGVLLSTSAQPGWKDARWLGAYHTSGAIVLGCAEMILLASLWGEQRVLEVLRPALAVLLVFHAVPLFLLTAELRPTLDRVFDGRQRGRAVALILVGGVLIPLGLALARGMPVAMLAAAVLILVGNLSARFVLVKLPHLSARVSANDNQPGRP